MSSGVRHPPHSSPFFIISWAMTPPTPQRDNRSSAEAEFTLIGVVILSCWKCVTEMLQREASLYHAPKRNLPGLPKITTKGNLLALYLLYNISAIIPLCVLILTNAQIFS